MLLAIRAFTTEPPPAIREIEEEESVGWSFRPTVAGQCWSFIAGSALFAIGSAPGSAALFGAQNANLMFFVGAWFFTGAGLVQWALAGPRFTGGSPPRIRAQWLTAAAQSVGTVLFNVSTSAAVMVHSTTDERDLVWSPDFSGSVAFLVSGAVALIGLEHTVGLWPPASAGWWATVINFLGCVLFMVSAIAAYVSPCGVTEDAWIANLGTCTGAVCFLVASALTITRARRAS